MIYRENLKVLETITPGTILTCDSLYNIRVNIGAASTWHHPPAALNEAIRHSFEHYFSLVEIVHSPHFKQATEIHIPNLNESLSGIITLAESYQTNNMGSELVEGLINLHNVLHKRLTQLIETYPNFFVNHVEKKLTFDECQEQLKHIESSLESMMDDSDETSSRYIKAKKLLHYVNVMKETLKNCCQSLNEKAVGIFRMIVSFFYSLRIKSTCIKEPEEDLITSLGYAGMSGDEDSTDSLTESVQ